MQKPIVFLCLFAAIMIYLFSKAISKNGGVIGINACTFIVGDGDIELLLDHIDHIIKIGGIEHVGLGPDFIDYALKYFPEADRAKLPVGTESVAGMACDEDIFQIAAGLKQRGYASRDINLVMGENFIRIFRTIL